MLRERGGGARNARRPSPKEMAVPSCDMEQDLPASRQFKLVEGFTVLRVLIVDDHRNTRESLAIGFQLFGCLADPVAGVAEALERLHDGTYDCVISDVRMPGATGLELARIVSERFPAMRLILMSAYEVTPDEAAAAAMTGATLMMKPVTAEALGQCLRARSASPLPS